MRYYLDIDVGDPDLYRREKASYDLALEYVHACGDRLGLDPNLENLENLDEGFKELLVESFKVDPNWNQKGTIR